MLLKFQKITSLTFNGATDHRTEISEFSSDLHLPMLYA